MKVFCHHVYEYKKGLRSLILHTEKEENRELMENKLNNEKISFMIYPIKNNRVNIFFGASECIEVIKKINKNDLVEYTPEEDFILGIMLGYDRVKQCERYLNIKNNKELDVLIG